jgi:hypothetical protein
MSGQRPVADENDLRVFRLAVARQLGIAHRPDGLDHDQILAELASVYESIALLMWLHAEAQWERAEHQARADAAPANSLPAEWRERVADPDVVAAVEGLLCTPATVTDDLVRGDRVRVTYETSVARDGFFVGKGAILANSGQGLHDVRNATVERVAAADVDGPDPGQSAEVGA